MSVDVESLPETYNFEIEKKVVKPLAAVGTVGMDWALEKSPNIICNSFPGIAKLLTSPFL